MNDLEEDIINSIEDDMDLTDNIPEYQVWVFDLDEQEEIVSEALVYVSADPESAVNYAKNFKVKSSPENLSCEILVETVVDFGDYTENIATLYREIIKN